MRPERVLPQYLILLKIGPAAPALCGTYTIAKPPRLARATRSPSDDHEERIEATRSHEDAVDANFKLRN